MREIKFMRVSNLRNQNNKKEFNKKQLSISRKNHFFFIPAGIGQKTLVI